MAATGSVEFSKICLFLNIDRALSSPLLRFRESKSAFRSLFVSDGSTTFFSSLSFWRECSVGEIDDDFQ